MLFCDITPPCPFEPVLAHAREWIDAGTIVLDHHKGAKPWVSLFCDAGLGLFADEVDDPGVSGALLAFEVWTIFWMERRLCPPTPHEPRIRDHATLAGIRDTWQNKHERWEEACWQKEALMLLSHEELLAHEPFLDNTDLLTGKRLWRRHVARVKYATEGAMFFSPSSARVKYAVMNESGPVTSDAADVLFAEHPDLDFIGGWTERTSNGAEHRPVTIRRWSLRSRSEFDVSKLARAAGGNGHTKAAGFSSTIVAHQYQHAVFEILEFVKKAGLG